jgi:hypothetical protein
MAAVGALADSVGTVRAHAARDTPETRLAVSAVVGRLALPSRGRSPRAILVVRSVDGRAADAQCDPAGLSAEVQRQVDVGWRTAQRPGAGAAGANAVVFHDLVELLAHYLADLATGRAEELWWWVTLHRRLAVSGRVADVLAEHIRLAPQVLAEVRRLGHLQEVATALDSASCERLVVRLAQAHAAPALPLTLTRGLRPTDGATGATDVRAVPAAVRERVVGIAGGAQRVFVAAALQLAADPLVARSPAFARGVAALAGRPDVALVRRPEAAIRDGPAISDEPASPEARTNEPGTALADRQGGAGSTIDPAHSEPAAGELRDPGRITAEKVDAPADQTRVRGDARRNPLAEVGDADPFDPPDPFELLPEFTEVDGVATGIGGVLFLVDVLLQFRGAEPDGSDWELADRLGWWGAIEVIGRSLLPADHPSAEDPVWAVLTQLAGGAPPDELCVWHDRTRPPLLAFLTGRLGCQADELPAVLLERPARVVYDRAQVDLYLPLAGATVAVRRAGFDRDPGWVPELSRVIAFHFDDDAGSVR